MARTEYVLDDLGLSQLRFAVSPLNELGLSLRGCRDPGRFPHHLPWLRSTAAAWSRLDGEVLTALANDRLWLPDFLTPRPGSPITRIEDELAALAVVDPEVVERHLRAVHPDPPPAVRGPATEVRDRIVAAVTQYWDACFAPWWPRMQALLQADITHRSRMIATGGLAEMFAGLGAGCALVGNTVTVEHRHPGAGFRRPVADAGLTVMPSLFAVRTTAPLLSDEPPMVVYPARGVGLMWSAERPPVAAAVAGVLGRARAGLLAMLAEPASSTEVAARLGVTTSAANQHLRALHAAGLLTAARSGRHVLYARSDLGDRLVTGC